MQHSVPTSHRNPELSYGGAAGFIPSLYADQPYW